MTERLHGAGLGFRPELAADLLRQPEEIDFIEAVAENALADPGRHKELVAVSKIWPVALHGVKLSLGTAAGIDESRARDLGRLAKALRASVISEHAAITRGTRRDIGHLTAIPYDRESLAILVRNIGRARCHLPDVPFLIENIAWTLRFPTDGIPEGDFYAELVELTGCSLLLDLSNLYANALNSGQRPEDLLATYPVEHTAMLHIAGGAWSHGFYLDTHAHPAPDEVFDLLPEVFRRAGAAPALIERDGTFPPFSELLAEVSRTRRAQEGFQEPPSPDRRKATEEGLPGAIAESRVREQDALAELLTRLEPPGDAECGPFDPVQIRRSRDILLRKRVDEALPLLGHLSRVHPGLDAVAREVLDRSPRHDRGAAIADAMRVAETIRSGPREAEAATRDLLSLKLRFRRAGNSFRPRRGPGIGCQRLESGRRLWAFRGPGAGSRTHFFEEGGPG